MATHSISTAQRFGSNAGRACLWVRRKETAFVRWVASKGVPAPIAKLFVLLFNFAAIAALCYVSMWIILFVILLTFVISFNGAKLDESGSDFLNFNEENFDKGEYTDEGQGFGYYIDGYRVDSHDVND